MNRTSSKSRSLKIQREVVRVLDAEQLASVGGGDGVIITSRLPNMSVCHPAECGSVIIRPPIDFDPIFRPGPILRPGLSNGNPLLCG